MATIYIDIGHGGIDSLGKDTGTSGKYNGKTYYENEINLLIGLEAKRVLESYGHTVVTQRTENVNFGPQVGSYSRADSNLINSASYCKNTKCDCMVSIHNNAYSDANARGYVLIYKAGSEASDTVKAKSKDLCDKVEAQIKKTLPKNDVRKKISGNGQDYYGILRLHDKAGVLIEVGFMSNTEDMRVLVNQYKTLGKEIADGINNFVGGAVSQPSTPSTPSTPPVTNPADAQKILELQTKVVNLEATIETKDYQITSLQAQVKSLESQLTKALKYDVDGNGVTNEEDAVYLLKHIIDPTKYPLPKK